MSLPKRQTGRQTMNPSLSCRLFDSLLQLLPDLVRHLVRCGLVIPLGVPEVRLWLCCLWCLIVCTQ